MLRHPSIVKITGASEVPGDLIYWTNGGKRIGGDQELPSTIMYRMGVDYDFFNTFDNEILAGRVFSPGFPGDSSNVIINRRSVDVLGFKNAEEAIGGLIDMGGDTLTVVGVVENYHQEGLKNDFRQTVFHLTPNFHTYYCAKIGTGDLTQTLAYAKGQYNNIFPGNPFDYFFLDNFFNRQYQSDRQLLKYLDSLHC